MTAWGTLEEFSPLITGNLHVQPPRLIKLLQALLDAYHSWLQHEKFSDPFSASLRLDTLRLGGTPPPPMAAVMHRQAGGGDGGTASMEPDDDIVSDSEGDDDNNDEEDGAVDEDGLLHIMEVLELPRSTAIDLLVHHGGDVEAAIMSAFS